MPWYEHKDGATCKSGRITFGTTSRAGPSVIYKTEETAYFQAPAGDDGALRRLDRAGHQRLETRPDIDPVTWPWQRAPFTEPAFEQMFRDLGVRTIGDIAEINRRKHPRLAALADEARTYLAPWLEDPHSADEEEEDTGTVVTEETLEQANRHQLWSLVKDADPDDRLGVTFGGSDADDADTMREALAEHHGIPWDVDRSEEDTGGS